MKHFYRIKIDFEILAYHATQARISDRNQEENLSKILGFIVKFSKQNLKSDNKEKLKEFENLTE